MSEICKPPMPVAEDEDEIVHYDIPAKVSGDEWDSDQEKEASEVFEQKDSLHEDEDLQQDYQDYSPIEQSGDEMLDRQQQQSEAAMYYTHQKQLDQEQTLGSMSFKDKIIGSQQPVQLITTQAVDRTNLQSKETKTYPQTQLGETIKKESGVKVQYQPTTQMTSGMPEKHFYLNSLRSIPDTIPVVTHISPTTTVISYSPQKVLPQTVHQIHESRIHEYRKNGSLLMESSTDGQPTLQKNPALISEDLNAAITCGRVYGPEKAAFVPGEVVRHAGMTTLYDCMAVPTFETELEVLAVPQTVIPTATKDTEIIREQSSAPGVIKGTGIAKKVLQAHRRMYCC